MPWRTVRATKWTVMHGHEMDPDARPIIHGPMRTNVGSELRLDAGALAVVSGAAWG